MRAAGATRCLLAALLLLSVMYQRAAGAEADLSLNLVPLVAQARSSAPVWVDFEFDLKGRDLLEGQLEIVLMDGNEFIGLYESGELVLANGIQRFRVMLPQMHVRGADAWVDTRIRFVSNRDQAVYDLGEHTISVPTLLERSLVICISAPREDRSSVYPEIAKSISLERFDPEPAIAPVRTLSTFPANVPPPEMPIHPLGYCSYDVVLLTAEGFAMLRKRQLDALSWWVEAGGSVLVFPDGNAKPDHVQFLNRLAGGSGPAFQIDSQGVLYAAEAQGDIRMYHCGLGRAVVALMHGESPPVLDSPEWRAAVAFLWKIRKNQLPAILSDGKWHTDLQSEQRRPTSYAVIGTRGAAAPPQLALYVLPIGGERELADRLMPETIRSIPLGIVALILVSFALAVGPLDYYVLGALRWHRFTWVLFPAVCVGFAALAVYLAQYYMGSSEYRRSLVLADIGTGGRVVRWSRCELRFAARGKDTLTRVTDGLFARVGQEVTKYDRYSPHGGFGLLRSTPPAYRGWMPGSFEIAQRLPQWSPMLCRTFSMEPFEPAVEVDWDAIGASDFESPRGLDEIRERLPGVGEARASFFVLHGFEMQPLPGSGASQHDISEDMRQVLKQVCVRPQVGFFSVVSQISPTGADNFEDLSVLDPTDTRQWLLLAVVRDGEDYVVYRRLYCGEP